MTAGVKAILVERIFELMRDYFRAVRLSEMKITFGAR
jgi:hypothetical protein